MAALSQTHNSASALGSDAVLFFLFVPLCFSCCYQSEFSVRVAKHGKEKERGEKGGGGAEAAAAGGGRQRLMVASVMYVLRRHSAHAIFYDKK